MTGIWALAALWLGLALIAYLLSIWLRVSTALSEIIVGTIAQLVIGAALFPFFGCAAAAYFLLSWNPMASWLGGVALSTTSVAVVCAVMLESGLNTEYGKTVLAACFINDLGTVLALGFIFAPFTLKTLIFAAVAVMVFAILPWLTPRFSSSMAIGRRSSRPSSSCCVCSA